MTHDAPLTIKVALEGVPEVKALIQRAYDDGFRDGQASERKRHLGEVERLATYTDIDERVELDG